jgi:hypothetical protein
VTPYDSTLKAQRHARASAAGRVRWKAAVERTRQGEPKGKTVTTPENPEILLPSLPWTAASRPYKKPINACSCPFFARSVASAFEHGVRTLVWAFLCFACRFSTAYPYSAGRSCGLVISDMTWSIPADCYCSLHLAYVCCPHSLSVPRAPFDSGGTEQKKL